MRYLNFLLFFVLSGCAFINVSLVQPPAPLREVLIEGEGHPKILLVDISGIISEKDGTDGQILSQKVSMVARIRETLKKAEKDGDIAGVILKINSPGGTVAASDIIYHELIDFKRKKGIPLYACIASLGTSGGYYVATAADKIFAHPTAITGSIGVIALKFNIEGLLTKIGIENETIKSRDKKDLFSPFRATTPEEREIIQRIINSMHNRFVDVVFQNRKSLIKREELEALSDGRIYTSEQALEAKLVDHIGYLDEIVDVMKKTLGVKEAKVVTYHRLGEYKGTIYSAFPEQSHILHLLREGFGHFSQIEFMYLWMP